MRLLQRLDRLDPALPREGETRIDVLRRMTRYRILVPRTSLVFDELVHLHDKVAELEARLAALERP